MDGGRMFVDRRDAGRQLAEELRPYAENGVVLGLPRGGVIVAREVADALGLPLDVAISCKLCHPSMLEFAIGAVDPDGHVIENPEAGDTYSQKALAAEVQERTELARERLVQYRAIRAEVPLSGRTAILVDDGLATGLTMRLAARGARSRGASRVVIGVPVGPADSQGCVGPDVDVCVVLERPPFFRSVGQAYVGFDQVGDEEALNAFRG